MGSLETLRAAVDDLKTKSDESFGITRDIRTSLADVQGLRNSVTEAMKREFGSGQETIHVLADMRGSGIEPYMEPNERWVKSTEMKEIINSLELERSRSMFVSLILPSKEFWSRHPL